MFQTKQSREVHKYKEEIERLETQRQNLYAEFQEASKIGDEGVSSSIFIHFSFYSDDTPKLFFHWVCLVFLWLVLREAWEEANLW